MTLLVDVGNLNLKPYATQEDLGLIPGSVRSPEEEMATHYWYTAPVFLPGESHGQGA